MIEITFKRTLLICLVCFIAITLFVYIQGENSKSRFQKAEKFLWNLDWIQSQQDLKTGKEEQRFFATSARINREGIWPIYNGYLEFKNGIGENTRNSIGIDEYGIYLTSRNGNWEITKIRRIERRHDLDWEKPTVIYLNPTWGNTPEYFRKAFGK